MLDGLESLGQNVAGYWPGRGRLATRIVVVTAHYDHLGRVELLAAGLPDSLSFFPGANDNASGMAGSAQFASLMRTSANSIIEVG